MTLRGLWQLLGGSIVIGAVMRASVEALSVMFRPLLAFSKMRANWRLKPPGWASSAFLS